MRGTTKAISLGPGGLRKGLLPRGPLLLPLCSDLSQLPLGYLSVCFRNRGGKGQSSKRTDMLLTQELN